MDVHRHLILCCLMRQALRSCISEIKIFRDEATIDLGKSVSDVAVRVMDIYGKVIEIIETNRDKVLIKSRNKAKGTYFVE